MMIRTFATILIAALGIAIALVAAGRSASPGGGFSELHRGDITGTDDLEVVMGLIERSDESKSGKHYHPGGEFGFVLEGAITVSTKSDPEATLRAGDSFYQPPGEWHVVGTTAEGAKTVVFRVLKKGQPVVVAVE
jgi:quercetin dioxygenase-like cupin family protein